MHEGTTPMIKATLVCGLYFIDIVSNKGSCEEHCFLKFYTCWKRGGLKDNELGVVKSTVILYDVLNYVVRFVNTYTILDLDYGKVDHVVVKIFPEGVVRKCVEFLADANESISMLGR